MEHEEVYQYSVKNSDGFNMWLDGVHVHAKNKVLTLNKKQHEELQKLIKSGRFDISSELVFLDHKAAEAMAKEYIKTLKPQAHQGPSHSAIGKHGADDKPKEVNPEAPSGGALSSLQERIRASRDNVLSEQESKPETPARNLDVVEEDAIHASDVAPASEKAD